MSTAGGCCPPPRDTSQSKSAGIDERARWRGGPCSGVTSVSPEGGIGFTGAGPRDYLAVRGVDHVLDGDRSGGLVRHLPNVIAFTWPRSSAGRAGRDP